LKWWFDKRNGELYILVPKLNIVTK
jgi:hypothetical protein